MKVLLLGATGNLGSRLLPALQAHGHQVVVFIRSESKLKELVPISIISKSTVVMGNASDSNAVREALVRNRCDALINSAGQANIFPWQAPRMQDIIQAVITGAIEASKEMGKPVRAWFLGGMSALDYPGFHGTRLTRYLPMFTEHLLSVTKLQNQTLEHLQWSLFCPSVMSPASKTIEPQSTPRGNPLIAANDEPAGFSDFYISWVPFIGPLITVFGNAGKYNTTLEDCADFLAADLENGDSTHIGHRVGIYDTGKMKAT